MRVMVIVKTDDSMKTTGKSMREAIEEMGRFNEQLVNAGVMLMGEGLTEPDKGKRVTFRDAKATVVDGPFAETKELVSGFWIWQVASMEEAAEWLQRAPFVDAELEIRKVAEAEDFGEEFTPEQREAEDRLRARLEQQQA